MVFPRTPWGRPDLPAGQHWSDRVVAQLALAVGDNTIVYSTGYLSEHPGDPLGFEGQIVVFTDKTIVRTTIEAQRPELHSIGFEVTAPVSIVPTTALDRLEILSVDAIPEPDGDEDELSDWLGYVEARAHIGGQTIDLPLTGGRPARRDEALAPFLMQAFTGGHQSA